MRWLQVGVLSILEPQDQPVAGQQHQLALDALEPGKGGGLVDIGDRQPPGPDVRTRRMLGMDFPGPAQAVAPAHTLRVLRTEMTDRR